MLQVLITLASLFGSCTGNGKYYVAAVAEHLPVFSPSPIVNISIARNIMMKNVDAYEHYIAEAKKAGAQIIVLPEGGTCGGGGSRKALLPFMENFPTFTEIASRKILPCIEEKTYAKQVVLRRLSCLARRYSIAVVVNVGDIQPCQPVIDPMCPTGLTSQYNTDLAFDTDGRLLAKYHKVHLYTGESAFYDGAKSVDYAIFETSFGVTFGMFTCFDILFDKPAQALVREYGVKNIVFPTAWFNEFPYLVSIELQQAWSRATGANLLASNLHYPGYAFTGSGIFSGGRDLGDFLSFSSSETKVIIANVPVNPEDDAVVVDGHGNDHFTGPYFDHISGNHPPFIYRPMTGDEGKADVCYQDFCCHAEYSRQSLSNELYVLGAFSGFNKSEPEEYKMQVCTLMKCPNASLSSCGQQVFQANTIFSSLTVNGTFSESTYIFPMFITGDRQVIDPEYLPLRKGSMSYKGESVSVLTATLYGRIFTD